jgi:hypothetical protein
MALLIRKGIFNLIASRRKASRNITAADFSLRHFSLAILKNHSLYFGEAELTALNLKEGEDG